MSTPHNAAAAGDFAKTVLMPLSLIHIYYTPGMQSYGQPELPEPISMGSYLGMSLWGMVPVIGLVFLLVWALDSPGRPNRRNFARGFLAARVIAWAVFFVSVSYTHLVGLPVSG